MKKKSILESEIKIAILKKAARLQIQDRKKYKKIYISIFGGILGYLLQKINKFIFKNVEELMFNINSVTTFLKKQNKTTQKRI